MIVVKAATNNLSAGEQRVPPRLDRPTADKKPVWLVLGALAVVAAGVMLFWFNPAESRLYPGCFFHAATGLHCPGCGGTRAMHQLLHGQVMTAFHLNALLVVLSPFFAWLGIRSLAGRIGGRPTEATSSTRWLWMLIAMTVAFGVIRNLPAFAWLAP